MFNTGKFAQKTVVISGASRGIGKQIALKLAKDGANIVICAKTTTAHPKLPGTIYSAAEEIIKAGGKALPCVVDVRDEKSVQDAVEAAVKEFGGIDILVNNASAISLTGTLDTPMKRYDLMHGVNTRGTFLMSQKCIPYLRQAKNPHILNLSPPLLMEQQWFEHHVAYTMAKYGMSMCVLGMSAELKQHGIAVNAIWPRTAIWTAAMDMITAGTGEAGCRKADIMADAAYAMLSKNSREYTGNFEIDDVVLTREGVTDFDQYACVKGVPLLPDFFVPGISYQAALGGHSVSEEKGGGAREKSRDSLKAVDLKALSDDIAKSISSETAQKIEAGHEFALRDDLKIDFDELSRKLDDSLQQSKSGEETEVDKEFMNFRRLNEANTFQRSSIFTWKTALISLALGGVTLTILLYMRKIRHDERERNRKRMIGKANIGGEWELLDMDGKPATSRDLLGNWVLIYFGFTNCPDICPEEIEKMIDVVDTLDRDEDALPVIPVFISVDPARDTPERVKKYCSEFSPKLRGFTGSKEQVEKVTKAYRVYHSEGPKTEQQDDYIVDHTVIMYLVDPNGEFHDYYSQNRRSGEVANVIRNKALKYEMDKRKNNSFF